LGDCPQLALRPVDVADRDLVAAMNLGLIADEGHRNPMTVAGLRARLDRLLDRDGWRADLFVRNEVVVGYALWREETDVAEASGRSVHLRQLYVVPEARRRGVGRSAFRRLEAERWPAACRVVLDVLLGNAAGRAFWAALGFSGYAMTLERLPEGGPRVRIDRLDHLVLTVASIEATCAWYERVLGMRVVTFGAGRTALVFGRQKINLHQVDRTFEPKAMVPTAGSADFCLIAAAELDEVIAHLDDEGVPIEHGPAYKAGATGAIRSVYVRDPDGNLIEISVDA
jgi:catechol 2,3-dioxygenase-like lactoylglutathione lyase family enzyme/predicted acetyltransferase